MNAKEKTLLTLTILGTIMFGATTIGLLAYNNTTKNETQTYKKRYLVEEKKYNVAQQNLRESMATSNSSTTTSIANQDDLKNNLQTAVNTVFTAYYTFDTKNADQYITRDDVAKKYMTQAIDDQLFPASSKIKITDGQFVSLLHGNPVIYIKSDSSSVVSAIVDCNFSVEAFGTVTATNDYYFQITYDTSLKQVTGVTELGKLQKSTN